MKRVKALLIVAAGLVGVCLFCLAIGTIYNMTPQGKASNATSTAQAILRQTELARPTRTASPAPTLPARSAPTVALELSTATPARPTATGTATRAPATRIPATWTPRPAATRAPIATLVPQPTSSACPVGAMAICCDGTVSFSTSRSGTCSRHQGVCRWCP